MRKLKNVAVLLALLCLSGLLHAQNKESPVGKFMRSDERSYVVIAVMLTILIGLVLYIVRLDRKIGKLERNNGQ